MPALSNVEGFKIQGIDSDGLNDLNGLNPCGMNFKP